MTDTPRDEAKRKGAKTYKGAVCETCWKRDRYTSNRACVHCHAQRYANMSDSDKAREAERVKAWRARKKAERDQGDVQSNPSAFDSLFD